MKKPTIYIESTIPSYLTSRDSRDLLKLSRQIATRQWWELILPNYDPVISEYVTQEIRDGDPQAAKLREKSIQDFKVLKADEQVERLAKIILKRLHIPKDAELDAYHLAISVTHKIDYVLSWNFEHIVGPPVRKTFAEIGMELQISMPILCTPFDFLK